MDSAPRGGDAAQMRAMTLAVLGAGAVGPAAAALAALRGHAVRIWSPSGSGTAGMGAAIEAEGVLEGRFAVHVAATLEAALDGADAAFLAVPAYALDALLPSIAAVLPPAVPLLISPAASLSPLVFEALMARHGTARAPVGALATTPCGGRRIGPARVRVAMVRSAVDIAAVPAREAPRMATLAGALFGNDYPCARDALAVALAGSNPIAHGVLALTNLTRIERREAWPQYEMMTEAACRLMLAMDAERAALAASFGVGVTGLVEALARANRIAPRALHEMAAEIAAGRGAVLGPTELSSRYIMEDVPFGLGFYLALAAPRGVPMPVTAACTIALEASLGQDLRANPLLARLDLARLDAMLAEGIGRMDASAAQ
jgi:opine dehydrogenase